ncbi:MAG: hypothetical protein LBQ20_08305 [Rhodanobacter sp.]|nr:hypothetical protein [Rhodanobacter sp.]
MLSPKRSPIKIEPPVSGTEKVLADFDEIKRACVLWGENLLRMKENNAPTGFTWYGYDILSNIWHIDALLDSAHRDFFARIQNMPIADIGAADGDLAFFFEHLGFEVDVIDWPSTNWNGMRGVRALKELLDAGAWIHEIDLDSQFRLPRSDYGFVFLLGILYHLKNPFYVMEQLARATRYCVLSTRVARRTVDGGVSLDKAPLAYLLAPDECNNDATNYWIFSLPGLLRLAERTGWRVLACRTVGDTAQSDPSSIDHDERAFLLLESVGGS